MAINLKDINTSTYDKYQIQFNGTQWTVTDTTTNSSVTPTVTSRTEGTDTYYKLSFNNMEITLKNPSSDLNFTYQIKSNPTMYSEVAINDINKIAAAGENPIGPTSGPMDNDNARNIYDLLDTAIIGNSNPVDFYRSMVSEIGVYSSSAQTQKSFQQSLVQQIDQKRQDISGVSLDEEAVNLVKYQKMYEASARVIKVADEILKTLFDMVS